MELDLERVRANVRSAQTEDLLDRATIYRTEMEPEALEIIDAELIERGVTREQVQAHIDDTGDVLRRKDGAILQCSFCRKPATFQGWGWHRLYGEVPIFPRWFRWCKDHYDGNR